jgi:hypothetical protein
MLPAVEVLAKTVPMVISVAPVVLMAEVVQEEAPPQQT